MCISILVIIWVLEAGTSLAAIALASSAEIAAKAVAEKMKIISKKHQILCITHLPAIAAQGESNYYIYKEIKDNKTKTNIKRLNEEETIYEIARISNGNISEIAIENAKELRKVC